EPAREGQRRPADASGRRPEAPLRGLHPQEHGRGARPGVQHPRRPARRLRAYVASQRAEGGAWSTTATM
ncbi:MAG: hypothetical protein AVDCRST_MAG08-402, partial [uncultured Acetobacteraceae bacterium]